MKALDIITFILLLVGGINWGLIGFFDYNVVEALLGDGTQATRIVYCLVGLCALYELLALPAIRRRWQERRYGTTTTTAGTV